MEKHFPRTKKKMLKTKYGSIVASEILLFSLEIVSTSFPTAQTVACQAPLSMEFSRQEYWSGLPFPSSWGFPDPGIKPTSPALQEDFYFVFTTEPPGELWLKKYKSVKEDLANLTELKSPKNKEPSL